MLALWDVDDPPLRLDVETDARFEPEALVELWLIRTTVVEEPAPTLPVFLIFQLALTVLPERLTEPLWTCRSGGATVKDPMRTMSSSSAVELCPAVLVLSVITQTW